MIAVSGAGGFLGWHCRALAHGEGIALASVSLRDPVSVPARPIAGVTSYVHLAGINRGSDEEVRDGNVKLARRAARALLLSSEPPRRIVFAGSTQRGTAYAEGKLRAADVLRTAAQTIGADFDPVELPHLFGENGRPDHNSVTATFCHRLAEGRTPRVTHDAPLRLLHAQTAASRVLGCAPTDDLSEQATAITVGDLLSRLSSFDAVYRTGDLPDLAADFDLDLFNAYRFALFPHRPSIALRSATDNRGGFTEAVRSHGYGGQVSFSDTAAEVTRGQHYHRRKIERFVVTSGQGEIALRRLFDTQVVRLRVSGHEPTAVDMPTFWSHSITNVAQSPLHTLFWCQELFDANAPDTYPEPV